MNVEDMIAMQVALVKLALSVYPDKLNYVDHVLEQTEDVFNRLHLDQFVH